MKIFCISMDHHHCNVSSSDVTLPQSYITGQARESLIQDCKVPLVHCQIPVSGDSSKLLSVHPRNHCKNSHQVICHTFCHYASVCKYRPNCVLVIWQCDDFIPPFRIQFTIARFWEWVYQKLIAPLTLFLIFPTVDDGYSCISFLWWMESSTVPQMRHT